MSIAMRPTALLLAAALVVTLWGCSKSASAVASGGPAAAPVKVALAETRTLPVQLRTIGNVEAYKTISVKSQVTGTLMRVNFKEGDPVKKGQLLFEIDPRSYQETIRQFEANLARDKAQLRQAEANLVRDKAQEKFTRDQARRYNELARQGVFSREQSEQMASAADAQAASLTADEAAIQSSRSSIAAGQSAIENARLQLSYCYIYSPVDGRSGNISVKEGNLVKLNDIELVTLMQIQPVYVTFTLPEKQLDAVRERMRAGRLMVRAASPANREGVGQGALTFIDNSVDANTGTIKLKATFPNGDAHLWPGQFVDVELTLNQRTDVVAIPSRAVQIGQAGQYVFVVKPDQTVEMRPVVTGETVGPLVEVREGVRPGEAVVIDGHIRLAAGSRVKVQS